MLVIVLVIVIVIFVALDYDQDHNNEHEQEQEIDRIVATIDTEAGTSWRRTGEEVDMDAPRVLIVEDDRELSRLLAARLRGAGYDVSVAGDGAMAIMFAQKQRPYVVLLDIGLPDTDGLLVMKRLSALIPLASIPVIVITGMPLTEEQEFRIESQAFALLRKPLDMDQLLATVRAALSTLSGPPADEAGAQPLA